MALRVSEMTDTVFLLGAGFNRSVLPETTAFGDEASPKPPLTLDLFQLLLTDERFRRKIDRWIQGGTSAQLIVDLFEVINFYWHLSIPDLERAQFDLEEFLTFLLAVLSDPRDPAMSKEKLDHARLGLLNLLVWYLSELMNWRQVDLSRGPGYQLGRDVLEYEADVITFNYDLIAEAIIESVSGINPHSSITGNPSGRALDDLVDDSSPLPDDDLTVSFYQWNSNLGYGVGFDEVTLPIAGVGIAVPGSRYFKHPENALYASRRVLKLHGSINWIYHSGPTAPFSGPRYIWRQPGDVILERHPQIHPTMGPVWTPDYDGDMAEPLLIPPQLIKPLDHPILQTVWSAARETLSTCRRLVIVGYSFPPTDFHVRQLFLEVFARHNLVELIIVNPDQAVQETAIRLTHFTGEPHWFHNLSALYS